MPSGKCARWCDNFDIGPVGHGAVSAKPAFQLREHLPERFRILPFRLSQEQGSSGLADGTGGRAKAGIVERSVDSLMG